MEKLDVVIIGAGVVGLAIGRSFALYGREVTILEAHASFGAEASSHNSQVIHAGIYYPQGSLKARLCVAGKQQLYQYCSERAIEHRQLGKLIVATTDQELEVLDRYRVQAQNNGVSDIKRLSAENVRELEPEIRAAGALLSPSTGIVDCHDLMVNFLADIASQGGMLVSRARVMGGHLSVDGPVIKLGEEETQQFSCNLLVNAAGFSAPAVAASLGLNEKQYPAGYYAKGHYFSLAGKAPFSHLIYPVAESDGLGVHVTLGLDGSVRFGPDVEWISEPDYSFDLQRKGRFVDAIKRYFPALDESMLHRGYTGIRPKIAGPGQPAADFMIQKIGGAALINLYGIESPGLTACMAIADYVTKLGLSSP